MIRLKTKLVVENLDILNGIDDFGVAELRNWDSLSNSGEVFYYRWSNGDLILMTKRNLKYTNAQVDSLFASLGNDILTSESYSSEQQTFLESAFLSIVGSTNVFGLTSSDWELVAE